MIKIRKGVFETNSSSVHSLTIVTEEDYNKFRNGELKYDNYHDKLVEMPAGCEDEDEEYWSYDEFPGYYFETFEQKFITPSGDKMVAFGYYGHD